MRRLLSLLLLLLAVTADARGEESSSNPATLESFFSLYQPYVANIAAYEPMYFLVGTDPAKSRFQVSFKYRLFNADGPLARSHPWVEGFHLAYTQGSLWNLRSGSAPFEDTSYQPEAFFLSDNLASRAETPRGLFLQTGLRHESNGRGGELSRSTNFLYLEPVFILFDPSSRLGVQLAPRVWGYLNNDRHHNRDLPDYRGYFDLRIKFGRADTFVVGTSLRWAAKGPSAQVDVTYPLHRLLFDNLDLYFQIQYVNALAESLIEYRQRTEALRLGIAIVR